MIAPASRYTRVRSTAALAFLEIPCDQASTSTTTCSRTTSCTSSPSSRDRSATSRPRPESSACRRRAVGRPTLLADDAGCVVVLAPADAEVDTASVAELLGRLDLDPVPPDRAPGLTGYLLAFVPPVALECPATLVVDERVATRTSSTRPPASPA